jgi:dihydrodipicolinate synthase/N-acetylneuraminate lyase
MDRTSVDWAGPMPAVTTPFHDDGRIDEAGFSANIDRLIRDGATGVVVGGCTG